MIKLKNGLITVLFGLFLLGGDGASPPVCLAFLGDIMLGRGVAQAHAGGDWQNVFSTLTQELQRSDFSLANLESPLCDGVEGNRVGDDAGGYLLGAPEDSLEALRPTGLRIVSLANNHRLDCGTDDLIFTIGALEKNGIKAMTHGGQALFVDTRRGRFAFLAFDAVGRDFDIQDAVRSVTDARRKASVVIVSMHWGLEYQPGANERQKEQAQTLADAGAALIWGHHPHVLQAPAWVQGKGRSRPALVLYSLGNAVFDQHAPPDAKRSALVLVTFDAAGAIDMEVYPFLIHPQRGRVIAAGFEESAMINTRMKVPERRNTHEEICRVKSPIAEK